MLWRKWGSSRGCLTKRGTTLWTRWGYWHRSRTTRMWSITTRRLWTIRFQPVPFCALSWSTLITAICFKRFKSTRKTKRTFRKMKFGSWSFRWSMVWKLCMISTWCIGISKVPIYSWTMITLSNWVIWMCLKLLINRGWITPKLVRRTMPVLRSGETKLITLRAIFGRWGASSMSWSLCPRRFKLKICKAFSKKWIKVLTQGYPKFSQKIFLTWLKCFCK